LGPRYAAAAAPLHVARQHPGAGARAGARGHSLAHELPRVARAAGSATGKASGELGPWPECGSGFRARWPASAGRA
nr:hypothetical protein [Tanacetum cinerariifolium]